MKTGNITSRGKNSWRINFELPRDENGERRRQFVTVRGSKDDAKAKLIELLASVGTGSFVEPSKATVGDFVAARIDAWEASGTITARTAQRYRELLENQIRPHIGGKVMQKLRPLDIEHWHAALRTGGRAKGKGGVSARTIGHAHRVLSKALRNAEKNNLVGKNVCKLETAPKVAKEEMVIVRDVPALIEKLTGDRLGVPAMVSLFTGMRLGEVLALRWGRVDLDGKLIQVREAVEHTKAHGIRFKGPKSAAGKRDVTLPDILVDALREHRKAQLELRIKFGLGRLPEDALLFADLEGNIPSPNSVSAAWGDFAKRAGIPAVTFHALRHTHASMLIDEGVDVVTISVRLGHSSPDITLRVYSHLFQKDDGKAAAAINAALGANRVPVS